MLAGLFFVNKKSVDMLHNKLRCFYLLSQIVKNLSIKTDGGGGSVCIILRSDANKKASFPRV
jgi:hypothetical protein